MRHILAALFAITLASPALPADDPLTTGIKHEAERRAAAHEFSGALLVAKNGKPIVEGAYGGNDIDTKFRFGSMGKMFTAVAALQLIAAARAISSRPNISIIASTRASTRTTSGSSAVAARCSRPAPAGTTATTA